MSEFISRSIWPSLSPRQYEEHTQDFQFCCAFALRLPGSRRALALAAFLDRNQEGSRLIGLISGAEECAGMFGTWGYGYGAQMAEFSCLQNAAYDVEDAEIALALIEHALRDRYAFMAPIGVIEAGLVSEDAAMRLISSIKADVDRRLEARAWPRLAMDAVPDPAAPDQVFIPCPGGRHPARLTHSGQMYCQICGTSRPWYEPYDEIENDPSALDKAATALQIQQQTVRQSFTSSMGNGLLQQALTEWFEERSRNGYVSMPLGTVNVPGGSAMRRGAPGRYEIDFSNPLFTADFYKIFRTHCGNWWNDLPPYTPKPPAIISLR